MENNNSEVTKHFIEQIIEEDLNVGKWNQEQLQFRFPPEPNGFLHIGHSKSICLNFGLANDYNGKVNLRFDDTNPVTEKTDYVDAIRKDIQWLGFEWNKEVFTSDYFDQLYDWAVALIQKGKAYVDDSTQEEIQEMKGTPTVPGKPSTYRERTIEENLSLFEAMKNGEFEEGTKVLRAKIDLSSPNMHFRDPVLYRILHKHHHRTGDKWCIYPMYDFAHGQSDAIESVTHSICTLEFENHRPLYEWFLNNLEIFESRQIEFARLNINYTLMSKRKLLRLVEENHVESWDDPRMPTISGMRRRGFTARAIRNFCDKVGVAKRENMIEVSLLEFCVREDLNLVAERRMAILDPLKVVITNYPEDKTEWLPAENNPKDENAGSRELPFSREIYIEREDFMIDPPKKFFRLGIGRNVRLKHAYIITCDQVIEGKNGEIIEVHCRYFSNSKSGSDNSGIKAKGTLHWLEAKNSSLAKAVLYDRLFNVEAPGSTEGVDFTEEINPNSKQVLENILIEPELLKAKPEQPFQFLRKGYFTLDSSSTEDNLIFNRTITLKDAWAKKR